MFATEEIEARLMSATRKSKKGLCTKVKKKERETRCHNQFPRDSVCGQGLEYRRVVPNQRKSLRIDEADRCFEIDLWTIIPNNVVTEDMSGIRRFKIRRDREKQEAKLTRLLSWEWVGRLCG
jgi:uncharacterized protein (DUF488 family)